MNKTISVVVIIVVIAGMCWVIPRAIADCRNHRILKAAARTILHEAKYHPPEVGEYTLDSVCADYWGSPVVARLFVAYSSNSVRLRSPGRDKVNSSDDDHYSDIDIHIRRTLKKGVQETGKSWGKGLVQGVMEGIREESDEKIATTKKKASELISRFRKVDKENDE